MNVLNYYRGAVRAIGEGGGVGGPGKRTLVDVVPFNVIFFQGSFNNNNNNTI